MRKHTDDEGWHKKYKIWYRQWFSDTTHFPVYVRVYPNGEFVSKRFGKVLGRTPYHACPPSEIEQRRRDEYVYVVGLIPEKPHVGMDVPARWLKETKQEYYEEQVRKDVGRKR